jgi:large subunit ribosomal protein L10
MLKKKEKVKVIEELIESLKKSAIIIATDYRGLKAKEIVALRRQLRTNGIEYRVAKNTLTKLAAEKAGKKELEPLLSGPSAIAFGFDDVIKPAKLLSDFARTSGAVLKIKGGMLGNKALSPKEVADLASIPSKEILAAQLVGRLISPIYSLHNVLSGPMRGFAYVLQARIRKLEQAQ